jgi:hypothetical protein
MSDDYSGTPVSAVSVGGRSLGRESITTGSTEVPVAFYRTSHPPIFCGFQAEWVSGEGDDGTTFEINAGAGVGSKYATLRVDVPGHETIYEYVDITEVLQARVAAIVAEVTPKG